MIPTFFFLLLFLSPIPAQAQLTNSHIIVTGSVFCDVCYNNSFTEHSYFLPGVDVHLQCKFQANGPKTKEQITFSVNRTTNRHGVYRLDISSVEGVDCVDGPTVESFCEASLIIGSELSSSLPDCNVPAVSTSSKEITVKSRSPSSNLCVYSVSALTYTPANRNSTLCGPQQKQPLFDSSKFFLPYFPWPSLPPLPQLPPLPSLPPLPPFQFPPLPRLPPLPPLPPFPQFPPLPPLPPFPQLPPLAPLPPVSTPGSSYGPPPPRNWIPFPFPPSPPGFDLRDPRTWFPPSPNYQP